MSTTTTTPINNRITGYGEENPLDLTPNEDNWRLHPEIQRAAVSGALDEVGWIDDVTVNQRTGEEWPVGERNVKTVVDGHLRVEIAIAREEAAVPVKYVDLDPVEERKVLVTFDPLGEMAETNADMLKGLIGDLSFADKALAEWSTDLSGDLTLLDEKFSLPKLKETYGEPEQRDFWPVIRVQVSPETHALWEETLGKIAGTDEAHKVAQLLTADFSAVVADGE